MRQARLKPPQSLEQIASGRSLKGVPVRLSADKKQDLEQRLSKKIEEWKSGTSHMRARLRELNDHLEGVSEDVSFPWPGASTVTIGLAAGMARTLRATFERAVFPDHRPFVAKMKGESGDREARKALEDAINWLSMEHSNLVDALKDTPIPLFRDGTVPLMGEWDRRIERAVDYRTYTDSDSFVADYPTPASAGISEEKWDDHVQYLNSLDAELVVEYSYDEIIKDAPKFTGVPLARFAFWPISAECLGDLQLYGRQFYESVSKAKEKVKRGEYDEDPVEEATSRTRGGTVDDSWGFSRESIEGISSQGENHDRLELYRLVVKEDLDGDGILEKYILTFDCRSGKIFRINRYGLRRNIDNVVLFRFLKRDGRLLGVSLLDDGLDQFKMIDSIHRHRQNVRQITDAPAFLVPDSLKDDVDFGSEDSVFRPGITFYVQDKYMKEGMQPRQIPIQNPGQADGNSLDEEQSLVRYLEFRLGPSQGLSGQESMVDPRAPATKHLNQLKQATLRIDDMIREWKRSIDQLMELMKALYYQYGPSEIKYMAAQGAGEEEVSFRCQRELFRLDTIGFVSKHSEIPLSPEVEMERVGMLAAIVGQNPLLLQLKPELNPELWNRTVYASRVGDHDKLLVQAPSPQDQTLMRQMNAPQGDDLGAPTPNQQSATSMAEGLLSGGLNG